MQNLRDLYQEIILDHNKHPRNFREIIQPSTSANGFNRLCGDKLTIFVKLNDDVISDISFQGCGCAISQASASLMTDALMGKDLAAASALFNKFHSMVTSSAPLEETAITDKLQVLSGVRLFPARVKCATLAWHTFDAALKNSNDTVVTE
jgi:nitrogen fixation protein NifU and related proteins